VSVASVRLPSPLEPSGRELPSAERDRSGGERCTVKEREESSQQGIETRNVRKGKEGSRQADARRRPLRVGGHDLRLSRDVGRSEMLHLGGLGLDPTQRLEALQQEFMLRQHRRQLDGRVRSSLGDVDDGFDLLDLGVVSGRGSVEVGSDLGSEIGVDDEGLEDVLRDDKGERASVVLDVVIGDKDMLHSEREVGRRDGSDSPVGLGREHLLLVVGRRDGLDLVSVDVGRLGLDRGDLRLGLGRLLDLGHLLSLDGGSGDLHSEDDVSDLARGEGGDVDRVSLAEVGENEILERNLDLHPVLVAKRRPNVVGLGDGRLVRSENDLGLLVVDVEGSEDKDESREGGVRRDRLEPVVVEREEHHLGLSGSL
jgi:hypothetical protein